MNDIELLARYFILEESILQSIESTDLKNVTMTFKGLYAANITRQFCRDCFGWSEEKIDEHARDYEISSDIAEADRVLPGRRLVMLFKNVARLQLHRFRHGHPELLMVKVPPPDVEGAEDGPKTVFGFGFKTDTSFLEELGGVSKYFHHLLIDTIDARVEIVFEEFELENFNIEK